MFLFVVSVVCIFLVASNADRIFFFAADMVDHYSRRRKLRLGVDCPMCGRVAQAKLEDSGVQYFIHVHHEYQLKYICKFMEAANTRSTEE